MKVSIEKNSDQELVVLSISEINLTSKEVYETESRLLKNQNIRFVIEDVKDINADKLSLINKKYSLTKLREINFINCEFTNWNAVSEIFNRLRNNEILTFMNCIIPEFYPPNPFVGLKVNPKLKELTFRFCDIKIPDEVLKKFINLRSYSNTLK